MEKPKYIAQALKESHKKLEINTPLENYLKFQYQERYRPLMIRLGIEPKTFGKWLCTPIDQVN